MKRRRPEELRDASLACSENVAIERLPNGIIHFDATQVRRQKARKAAGHSRNPNTSESHLNKCFRTPTPQLARNGDEWWTRVMRDLDVTLIQDEDTDNGSSEIKRPIAEQRAEVSMVSDESAANGDESSIQAMHGPNDVRTLLLDFVVEQTGCARDTVSMNADLESELGIDSSVKARMLDELHERLGLELDAELSLSHCLTLSDCVDHAIQRVGLRTRFTDTGDDRRLARVNSSPRNDSEAVANQLIATSDTGDRLRKVMIGFVIEQTGFPEDMIDMESDLEGDLGIDSITKAQLIGEAREYLGLEQEPDLALSDFPTLASVENYLLGRL